MTDSVSTSPDHNGQAISGGAAVQLSRNRLCILVLSLALLASFALSMVLGASAGSFLNLMIELTGHSTSSDAQTFLRDWIVVVDIRLPRTLLAMLTGAALAISGAIMQSLFRNPLADPGIVGVTAGASLAAITTIVLGSSAAGAALGLSGLFAVPVAAFFGGLITTFGLYWLATRKGQTAIATLLLAGIAVAALAEACSGVLFYLADDKQLRDLTFWRLGSLAGANWQKVGAATPVFLIAFLLLSTLGRGLNAFSMGEATAFHLGISVERLKRQAILCVAAATGAAVAVSGGIGFVGIVVPHILRLVIGPDNRLLLPASALLGACLLTLADIVARTLVAPAEVPIGIVTALFGAPFFLWVVLRDKLF